MPTLFFYESNSLCGSSLKKRGDAPAVFLLMGTPKVALNKFVKKLYVLFGQLCAISFKVGKKGDLSIIQTIHFKPWMTFDNPRSGLATKAWKVHRGSIMVDPI